MSEHARLSASASQRWLHCTGALALEEWFGEDDTSAYAEEGTAAHELAELALKNKKPCKAFVGRKAENGVALTRDMAEYVQEYVDLVNEHAVHADMLLVESRVHYHKYLNVEEGLAFGTADAIILDDEAGELIVIDLKYGYRPVEAEQNTQLMLYALGAHEFVDTLGGSYPNIRMIICQPRIKNTSVFTCTVDDLMAFAEDAAPAAAAAISLADNDSLANWSQKDVIQKVHADGYLHPTEKGCEWCKMRSVCPAKAAAHLNDLVGSFDNLDDVEQKVSELTLPTDNEGLARVADMAPAIRRYLDDVIAHLEARLLRGERVPGYKLVKGTKGRRAWSSKDEAEQVMQSMRLKKEDMYAFSLITPTKAEKLLKDNPKRWGRLQPLVTQPEAKVVMAPASDKREAVTVASTEDQFDSYD